MASPAAWVLCFFALVGCGEGDPPSPDPATARATVLSGRVLDVEDGPVEGAEIFLAQEAVPWEGGGLSVQEREPLEMRRVLVGKTDASGSYAVAVPGSPDETRYVWLTARHTEFPFCTSHDPWVIEPGVGVAHKCPPMA